MTVMACQHANAILSPLFTGKKQG